MSTNIQAKANLIWEVATKLVGVYKPHEYGKVILPMTVLKRFDDILKPTKQAVLDKYEEVKNFEVKDAFLTEASGYCFYNTSKYDFEKLLSDPDNIESNFKNYLNGFSDNVIDILSNFKFNNEVKTMADNRLLYVVIEEFNSKKAYMGLDEVRTEDMGYIFEELVRKFSESYDEEAGAHFTARDIIYLMTDLLVAEEQDILINDNKVKTIYDMAMGTSQMLACMTDRLKQLNKNVKVDCYGQELNPETYAIAKADMLIKGGDADNFKQGDSNYQSGRFLPIINAGSAYEKFIRVEHDSTKITDYDFSALSEVRVAVMDTGVNPNNTAINFATDSNGNKIQLNYTTPASSGSGCF